MHNFIKIIVLIYITVFSTSLFAAEPSVLQAQQVTVVFEEPLRNAAREAGELYSAVKNELETFFHWPLDFRPTLILIDDRRKFQQTVSTDLIEFLIPVTIFVTGLWNVVQRGQNLDTVSHRFKYGTALFFGLIHGLGFSGYLRSLLGIESKLVLPLFSFNLGLEIGQIMIVLIVLGVSFLLVNVAGMKRGDWNLILSGAAMGVSLTLCIDRWPF